MALAEELVESLGVPGIGPYSQAIRIDHLIYTAGQSGIVPSTGLVAGDNFESQARHARQPLARRRWNATVDRWERAG